MSNDNFWTRIIGRGTAATAATRTFGPPPIPTMPPPPLVELILDSRHEFLRFTASVKIWYTTTNGTVSNDHVARFAQAAIHRRAEEVSRQYAVTQSERLRNELCVALYEAKPISLQGVTAAGYCTQILVRQEDREAVERYERTARRRAELAQELEIDALRGQRLQPLLTDPLRATAWWLGMNESRVDSLPEVAQTFTALRQTLAGPAGRGSVANPADTWGTLVDELVDSNDRPANHLLTRQLRRLFAFNGRTDLANRAAQLDGEPPTTAEPGAEPTTDASFESGSFAETETDGEPTMPGHAEDAR
ncbi:hypothetical protein AB0I55_21220 [Actinocatenispora sera]|uniref:hypothetical protein n=1 Tax=Actinocatenispora sera TaxID=390989 RepID=UPI0034056EC6